MLGPDPGDVSCAWCGMQDAGDLICTICGDPGPVPTGDQPDEETRVALWARRELGRCPACTAPLPTNTCAGCHGTDRDQTIVMPPESPAGPLPWPTD
jgi:hypothetical protein